MQRLLPSSPAALRCEGGGFYIHLSARSVCKAAVFQSTSDAAQRLLPPPHPSPAALRCGGGGDMAVFNVFFAEYGLAHVAFSNVSISASNASSLATICCCSVRGGRGIATLPTTVPETSLNVVPVPNFSISGFNASKTK